MRPRNRAWQAALIVAAITGSSVATWVASSRLRSPAPAAVSRLSVLPPTGTTLNTGPGSVVISPDGRTLAFITSDVASGRNGGVWLRSLDSPAARLLPGTDGADNPFWSPDGRYLGFFSEDGKLRKISVDGGRAEEICDAKDARGGTWSAKGVIVFAPTSAGALMQVPATGGTPKPATVVDTARGEIGHQFPMFLPDGDHFLYAVRPQRAGAYDIVVGSLSGTQRTVVLGAQGTPVFAPPNQLVFLRKGTLLAQRFDPDSRTLAGEPTALADIASAIGGGGFGRVSASSGGTIAYIADQPVNMHLVWFDQAGRQTGNVSIPPGDYGQVRLARDERQAVLTRRPSSTFFDLWLVDLDRGGASPFVNAAGWNTSPVWSPDGDRIAFATNRDGPEDIFVKSVSAGTPEEPLFRSKSAAGFKRPQSWSDDGKYVVYMELSPETSADLFVIPLGDRTPRAYLRTPAYETAGAISPDERWMAYVSAETGRNEVYVQTFPTPSRKHRVSSTGASEGGVWWRHDGKQLLFANLDHTQLLVADVDARADFSSSTPRVVGHLPKGVTSLDVTPDLQRILALVNEGSNAVWSITVVQNWTTTAR